MTAHQATAEVFFAAFLALPKSEKNLFLNRLAQDASIREGLIDLTIAKKRSKEKSIPLNDFLSKARR